MPDFDQEPSPNSPNLSSEQAARVEELRGIVSNASDVKTLKSATEELKAIFSPKPEQGEMAEGVLETNQKMYLFLGLKNPDASPIDLKQEYQRGNIILPTQEEREAAEKEGYTLSLIIPGHLKREDIIAKVDEIYNREFKPNEQKGVWFSDQAQTDLMQTDQALRPARPDKFYTLLLKPKLEATEAHPETKNNNLEQSLAILKQEQIKNPQLKLQGLTLPEYLLFDALIYTQEGRHLDQKDWSYLLEETVRDDPNNPNSARARCLSGDFYPGARELGVNSPSRAGGNGSSRLAAVFK